MHTLQPCKYMHNTSASPAAGEIHLRTRRAFKRHTNSHRLGQSKHHSSLAVRHIRCLLMGGPRNSTRIGQISANTSFRRHFTKNKILKNITLRGQAKLMSGVLFRTFFADKTCVEHTSDVCSLIIQPAQQLRSTTSRLATVRNMPNL